mgnify:CR=1 FL=1|jgi:hypothetical protein
MAKAETPINLAKKVTIVATEKAKYYTTGKEYKVQEQLAQRLVKEGLATLKK